MKLLVVVLNYKVADLTIDCLRSLEPEVRGVPGTRVAVVENGSADGSGELLREAIDSNGWSGWAELIVSAENLGYAGGNNLALRAVEPVPEFALLLNADTLVTPGAVEALVRFLEAHPEVGIAGSRLEFPDGGEQATPFRFPGIASELDRGLELGVVSRLLRRWAIRPPKPAAAAPVDWVAGASMMLRWRMVEQVGLLDEGYFAYFEDTDYCLRAARAGWSTWYVPESRVIHLEGRSSGIVGGQPARRPEYWFAARRRYFVKNHGAVYAAVVDAVFLVSLALRNVRRRLQGKAADKLLLEDSIGQSVFVRGFGNRSLGLLAAKGAFWTTAGFGASQILRFVGNVITTRLLAPELFGLMALGNVIALGLSLFTDFGVGPCIIRDPREDKAFLNTAWTLLVLRGLLVEVLAVALAAPLAELYNEPRLAWLIPLLGLSYVAAGFSSTQLFTMARQLQVRRLVTIEIGSQAIGVTTMVLWAWLHPSVAALIAGAMAPMTVKMVWSLTLGRRNRFAWERPALKELFRFGRWILVGSALTFLASQVDRLLLGKMLTLSRLGVYGIALTLSEMPRVLMTALSGSVLYPTYAKLAHLPPEELRRKVIKGRRPLLAGAALIVVLLAGTGDLIVGVLYDQRYAEAQWMLPVLALGLWPAALYVTLDPLLQAIGKPAYSAYAHAAKLVFSAVAIPVGFAHWGIAGAVGAVALNDLPHYVAIGCALARERLGSVREDLAATVLFAGACGAAVVVRWLFGLGLP